MYRELDAAWTELTQPGQMFEVETVEALGRTIKTYKHAPASLTDVWQMTAAYGDKDYLVYADERWTYAQAHNEVAAIAAWLKAQGVGQHDRVAIAMRNYPEWMLAYWAIVSIGAVAVGMNAWWVPDEMQYGLEDSAPKAIICDGERLERLLEIRSAVPHLKIAGVRLPDALAGTEGVTPWADVIATPASPAEITISPDDDACIFYTSGTTGRPKGAQLTHRGCVNNILNIAFAGRVQGLALAKVQGEEEAFNSAEPEPITALVATPLFHVTANNCVAHAATVSGGKLVHMYRWDAGEALRLIEKEKITNLSGVPVMSRELIAHPDFAKTDTSSLLAIGGGGAQLQPDLVGKLDQTVENARPSTGYGMTETCGIITSVGADFFVDKPASAGRAMPTFETKCIDANGDEVKPGEAGELCVKGAPVIKGYLNRPEATAESIQDGWLRTGDIVKIDEDGFIFIVDRAKDMVLRGGENVYCSEVESAIFEHDAVAECVVFGVPDDRLGEEVGAVIVPAKGAEVSADEIRAFCKAKLAAYKIPRYIWTQADPLPRNASGKFLKKELRGTMDVAKAS